MNASHEAMLYGAIRLLEAVATDQEVTLGDLHQSINDLYTAINDTTDSSPANAEENPMIFKFDDYRKKLLGGDFPRGAA